jgi:hypothetical protein
MHEEEWNVLSYISSVTKTGIKEVITYAFNSNLIIIERMGIDGIKYCLVINLAKSKNMVLKGMGHGIFTVYG